MTREQEIEQQLKEALPKIQKELTEHPPTIGLIGVSGVGKSSTINTLFKTNLAVSDTVACTKEFIENDINLSFTKGVTKSMPVQLRVIDAPGLGEDISRDPRYIEMYRENLPKCDVILWVLAARNRAVALDQMYLRDLQEFHSKIVFGLSQADLVEPMDWNSSVNLPSVEQERNLEVILQDRKEKIQSITGSEATMVAFSSKHGYQLQELFTTIITSCPPERAWIFESLQGFHYTDFIPKEVLATLEKKESKSWLDMFCKP